MLSKCQGEQIVVNRLSDGQVCCWRLDPSCTQLMHEAKLVPHGGIISTSDSCSWIGVVNMERARSENLEVWALHNADAAHNGPKRIASFSKHPSCFALKDQNLCTSCLLALAEQGSLQDPCPPIEIYMIEMDGSVRQLHQIPRHAPCGTLCFYPGLEMLLLSGNEYGLILIYDEHLQLSTCYGSEGCQSIGISMQCKRLVTTASKYFRIFKVSPINKLAPR